MTEMTLSGFERPTGQTGARNHVFVLPSVVCSALVARQIAEASGAVHVSHQHGCGHIGPDIVQTRQLFVGLAMNPNVAHALVVSLGCETVQGNAVASALGDLGRQPVFISIQGSGGNDKAREDGILEATALVRESESAVRTDVGLDQLVIGVTASRVDERIAGLVARALEQGARVVMATDRNTHAVHGTDVAYIDIGDAPTEPISVVRNAGSGAQLLAAVASCRAQVLVDFPAPEQPPLGFALAPVVSVAAPQGLHRVIQGEFDAGADADADAIWSRVLEVFDGGETRTEARGAAAFAIPRLIRTM